MQKLKYIVILLAVLLCSYTPPEKENPYKDKVILQTILKILNSGHYQPLPIDDSLSIKSFDVYIKRLDYNKVFLTQSDIDELSKYKYKIDDEIINGTFELFNLSNKLILKRIEETEGFYSKILDTPFDFNVDDSLELDSDKRNYLNNKKELKERWYLSLKYQTLVNLISSLEIQEKAIESKDTTVKIKTFKELEADARKKVRESQEGWINRLKKIEENDRFGLYVNSIVNTFDPHSDYFPPSDKENFDISMSGQLEGIGATLQEKDGYIKVHSIVPGSPSWKEGQLKEGDLILKVGQGKEEPVDVVNMRVDKAVKFIRGKKGTEVRLTVKKVDGSIVVISIIRDIVVIEETYAKSAILKDSDNEKIGYIRLPKFYADFNKLGGRSAGDDIEKELIKLKRDSAKAVIIDLRNDGGGSLIDAVKIMGLFIDKGPVVQVKSKEGAPYIFEDKDSKIVYDKPLIILVNQFSASASEILAAAVQDYDRGIIVGTSFTYGKGTVQNFSELDRFVSDETIKPLGALKLTISKFYRVNGGSTQLKGVIPDITLPSPYNYIDVGEKEQDYPMRWTEIKPVEYNKWMRPVKKEIIKNASIERVRKDTLFSLIEESALRLKDQKEKTKYTLNIEKYRLEQENNKNENKKIEKYTKEIPNFLVEGLREDVQEAEGDTIKTARIQDWVKEIKKDNYIYESFNIAKDVLRDTIQ
ncbi:MAG: hypothetical protein A2X12_05030 [Bacteroidetes bacterium GWE2_29_8]|nr:MAG: hypothetical protein A2X12_05030 [Bacteroidetes bacterium GWE2_29_8]OFY24869.1 MAG: hypothetical protein A2X02_04000 [Bacteroidetes bacterium GWF2_29_10]